MKEKHRSFFIIVGENLRKIRQKRGFSQQDVANRCDVDRAKISSIETAKEDFVLTTLLEIADALEVDVQSFFETKEKQ